MEENNTPKQNQAVNPEVSPQPLGLADQAIAAAQRLEAANKKMEENIAKQEALFARQLLSGRADAAQAQTPKEISPKEYMQNVLKNKV